MTNITFADDGKIAEVTSAHSYMLDCCLEFPVGKIYDKQDRHTVHTPFKQVKPQSKDQRRSAHNAKAADIPVLTNACNKGQRKLCCGSTRHTPTQPRMAERLPTKQTGQFEPMAAGSLPRWNCLTGFFLHVKNIRFSHDFPFILRIEEMPFYKLALPELGSPVSRPGASPRGFLVEVEDIPRIHGSVPFYA
jgi:hypothetical protein